MCIFYIQLIDLDLWKFCEVFHPEVVSCSPFRGKRKYATLHETMRKICKKLLIGLPRNFTFSVIFLKLQGVWRQDFRFATLEKYGLSFETKKYTTSCWAQQAWKNYFFLAIWAKFPSRMADFPYVFLYFFPQNYSISWDGTSFFQVFLPSSRARGGGGGERMWSAYGPLNPHFISFLCHAQPWS